MNWRLGTIGFSDADWAGPFYPQSLKPAEYLRFYSQYFDTVELDTTFYAMPDAARVRRWNDETPAHFQFAVKAPRAITHEGTIDQNVESFRTFVTPLAEFGSKLAAILLQFPPHFTVSETSRLDAFLSAIPRPARLAVEFRHRSWFTPAMAKLLRRQRVAFVSQDLPDVPRQIIQTADFLYVRWVGPWGRFEGAYGVEHVDRTNDIGEWKRQFDKRAETLDTIYGFFGNDFEGYAIRSANKLRRLIGLPIDESFGEPQKELF